MPDSDIINCRNCGHITAVDPTTAKCMECGEMVCLHCGCTNNTSCGGEIPCHWVRLGVCSACEEING